jgi:hypothetical protein
METRPEFFIGDLTSTDDIGQLTKAKEVGEYLNEMYPGHLWMVSWQGRAIVVKNLAMDTRYGFILRDHEDPKVMRHNAMLAGGELLERAKLPHTWDGELSTSLETR